MLTVTALARHLFLAVSTVTRILRIRADLVATQRALLAPLARAEREAVLKTLEGLVEAVTRWQDGCGPGECGPVSRRPGPTRRAGGSR